MGTSSPATSAASASRSARDKTIAFSAAATCASIPLPRCMDDLPGVPGVPGVPLPLLAEASPLSCAIAIRSKRSWSAALSPSHNWVYDTRSDSLSFSRPRLCTRLCRCTKARRCRPRRSTAVHVYGTRRCASSQRTTQPAKRHHSPALLVGRCPRGGRKLRWRSSASNRCAYESVAASQSSSAALRSRWMRPVSRHSTCCGSEGSFKRREASSAAKDSGARQQRRAFERSATGASSGTPLDRRRSSSALMLAHGTSCGAAGRLVASRL